MLLQWQEMQKKNTTLLQQSIRNYLNVNEWNTANESDNYALNSTNMQYNQEIASNAVSEIKQNSMAILDSGATSNFFHHQCSSKEHQVSLLPP